MTNTRTTIAALAFTLAGCLAPHIALAAELAVTVKGVRSDKGMIMAQLLKADAAKGQAVQAAATMRPAKTGDVELLFGDLAAGEYAVMLFHDENGNQKMDSNLLGIPTEGYGFSNEAKGRFGPPKFSEMKVIIGADGRVTTAAKMTY
jgi:uncharacterized protein (DUF2141 family)